MKSFRSIFIVVLTLPLTATLLLADWLTQSADTQVPLRTVSAVNGAVVWAAGGKGTVLRTINGGTEWQHNLIAGAEGLDLREVHGIDANTAYVMSVGVGDKSRIFKTIDGGKTWKLQFTNSLTRVSFKGLAFWDASNGIAFGDPVDGRFFIVRTTDGGESWWEIPYSNAPRAVPGETVNNASGTSIAVDGTTTVWIGTAGAAARVLRSVDRGLTWQISNTPLSKGGASGISSIAFIDDLHGVIVGGDHGKPGQRSINFARTTDGGKTWVAGGRLPGYRSAVSFVVDASGVSLLAVGPSGSDLSTDDGETWQNMGSAGYHAVSFLKGFPIGWAVGPDGAIGKWVASE